MSKYCPILQRKVVYLTCMECDEKPCKQNKKEETKCLTIQKEKKKDYNQPKEQ